jgi:ribonuclease BN (tRNA processing enzyme)
MKIIFLGTNGWYDTKTGNTLSILIATEEYNIVLDAGTGFAKLDRYLSNSNPIFLFLSHFHLDHLIGLHTLFKFSFNQKLTLSGPKGTEKVLRALLKQPFTAPLDHLSYRTEILEMPEGQKRFPFEVKGMDLVHPPLSMGYRFQLEGKVIAYCPDTGYCENAVTLAKGADLLIRRTQCGVASLESTICGKNCKGGWSGSVGPGALRCRQIHDDRVKENSRNRSPENFSKHLCVRRRPDHGNMKAGDLRMF